MIRINDSEDITKCWLSPDGLDCLEERAYELSFER